jgi:hypothetical protein
VQNEAMRIVTGAAKPTSCDSLRFWLGIQRIPHQQHLLMAKEFLRALSCNTHPLKQELEESEDTKIDQRFKTVRSWAVSAREAIEEICPVENIRIVNWIHARLDNLSTHRMGARSWRDRSSELNQSLIREWLEEHDMNVVIATDGSITDDVTAWGGAVWRDHKLIFQWSTARNRYVLFWGPL